MRASIRSAAPLAACVLLAAASAAAHAQARPEGGQGTAKAVPTVASADGTKIAYEKSGQGPVLILVSCVLSDRSGNAALASLLDPSFTVIRFDRRGRGDSGDAERYAVEREIEDIEALIDAAGGSAFLFGSSSGAALALEAANRLRTKVKAVALHEPPYIVDDSRPPVREGFFVEIGALVAAERRGDAVAKFMTEGIGVPEEMVAQMRQSPMWPAMERLAHTIPYDGAILAGLQAGKSLPKERWTSVTARTLVIDGDRSDAFLRSAAAALARALPGATRRTLAGQDHSAAFVAPGALVPVLIEFFAPGAAAAERGK